MRIAFLNLCHCDPEVVARVAKKLTSNSNFDMYIHVDRKVDEEPFRKLLEGVPRVYFISKRYKVYWGGYEAINATLEMLKVALKSKRNYDYFVTLQNLDYPIKSNSYIENFFEKNKGIEYIRGCKIAKTKDWHYARKYKIYNKRDDDFYINNRSKIKKYMRYLILRLISIKTILFNGVHKEGNEKIALYYGAAQWAITRKCAEYVIFFSNTHPKFNKRMKHIQFPDESYFHTIVHNSKFKTHCSKYDEEEKRWLVNWRNLHYFEFPKEVTTFTEADYLKLMNREELFCRKVRSNMSEELMKAIDQAT